MSNLFGDTEFVSVKVDPAYEIFRASFDKQMKPAKYAKTKGDFEQLNRLRRTMELPPLATPPQWGRACTNYFASPLSAYTLKDLATRYAVFVKSPLDRYNKPVEPVSQGGRNDSNEYLNLSGKPPDWSPLTKEESAEIRQKIRRGSQ